MSMSPKLSGLAAAQPATQPRPELGKVTAKPIDHADAATLIGFVESAVDSGSTVYTDDARAYSALPNAFNKYVYQTVKHATGEYDRRDAHTNSIEAVWAVFKGSIRGTWHHVSPKHLGRYVNDATIRLNEGACEVDTIGRMEQFARGVAGKRLAHRDLIAHNGKSTQVKPAR